LPGRAASTLPASLSISLMSNKNHTFDGCLSWPGRLLCLDWFG
jgi:hypothetical protein